MSAAEPAPRRGGWPGPRKPQWAFRPTVETEAAVAAYIVAKGLDPERDRSKAINALIPAGLPREEAPPEDVQEIKEA